MEKEKHREKDIPEKKLKSVEEITNLIKESDSVVIVSIKNLPTSQFQSIKKKLKDKAVVKVVKKNIINRAIDSIKKGAIKNFKKYLKEDQALIFSELDAFELSVILSKNKSMARAKAGQEVAEDIVIEPGPTELVPGPVVSELGNLGIPFAIEDGKINIRKKKVILKAGDKASEEAVSIMGKLDMKPIAVGLEPLVAYDNKEEKIYEDIKIDIEKTIDDLKSSMQRALGFAVDVVYYCKDTLKFLFGRASSYEKALTSKIKYEKEGIKTTDEELKEAKKAVGDELGGEGEKKEEENAQKEETKPEEEK